MEHDEFNLDDFFLRNAEDTSNIKVKRISLDMWGEKSFKSHKKSMSLNKFLNPFRISLLQIIIDSLRSNNIDIMVYAGTALAVWRDRGNMIPHDHDIDLAIDEIDFLRVIKTINSMDEVFFDSVCPFTQNKWFREDSDEQILYKQVGVKRLKVYFNENYLKQRSIIDKKFEKLLKNYDRTKLFIDIFTLQRKPGTNLYRVTWNIPGVYDNDRKCFPEDVLFPLREYQFEGLKIFGPRDIEGYLTIEYGYLGRDARYDHESQLYTRLSEEEFDNLPKNIRDYMKP